MQKLLRTILLCLVCSSPAYANGTVSFSSGLDASVGFTNSNGVSAGAIQSGSESQGLSIQQKQFSTTYDLENGESVVDTNIRTQSGYYSNRTLDGYENNTNNTKVRTNTTTSRWNINVGYSY